VEPAIHDQPQPSRLPLQSIELPVVYQPNYLSKFVGFREQFSDSFSLTRQDKVRADIGQRLKHEFSQVHPRMRQLQSLVIDLLIAAVKQVDVDPTRDIFRMIALAA